VHFFPSVEQCDVVRQPRIVAFPELPIFAESADFTLQVTAIADEVNSAIEIIDANLIAG